MSLDIAWKQNELVTDFYMLKLLLVVFDLIRRHSSVDSADKTFSVYCEHTWLMRFLANATFCQVPKVA